MGVGVWYPLLDEDSEGLESTLLEFNLTFCINPF